MKITTSGWGRAAALALTSLFLLTACGGAAPDEAADPDPVGATAGETGPNGTADATEPADTPARIVSLSPTATEMLFAIGAGDQVVAADEYSTYPDEAPTTDLSGFEPSIEAIAEHDPDLVVAAFDPGDLASGLEELSIPTLMLPSATTLDDTYAQIEQLGVATGHVAEAAEVVADIRTGLDEAVATAGDVPPGTTYYHELDNTYYSAMSSTFIGEIYGLFGLENIADAAEGAAESGGFPQLSPEFIIEADPDLVFLASATCCEVTAESVAERPGWGDISAVRNGNVVEVDSDITSRWGPRIVDFAALVAQQVAQLEPAGTASG